MEDHNMEPTAGVAPQEEPIVTAPMDEVPVVIDAPIKQEEAEATTLATTHANGKENYPSLYDTIPTTFGAIILGVGIIAGIQWMVKKIFEREKAEHKALTQFVTAMFALIAGLWVADKVYLSKIQ